MSKKRSRSEAGRMGGQATVMKHGREHMSKIGKLGAATLWQRYRLIPWQLSKFMLVKRENQADNPDPQESS